MPRATAVRLLVTSLGNEFMLDIARMLARGFEAEGVTCTVAVDGLPAGADPTVLEVVIAPHEYFPLFAGRRLNAANLRQAHASVFALNTEQPGSQWFALAVEHTRACRGAFDISAEGAAELTRRGIGAVHAPLGYVDPEPVTSLPSIDDRDIDLLFLGYSSPRRDRFLAACAELLPGAACHFALVDVHRPRQPGTPGYLTGEARSALLARSRILINVHGGDRRYFETHRAMLAFSHGCLFASETSRGTAPLEAGTHFVMTPLHDLAGRCRALLDDTTRLARVAAAGHDFARDRLNARDTAARMMEHMGGSATSTPAPEHDDETRRRSVAARLRAAEAARSAGETDWSLNDNPAWASLPRPAVSVVVTVHDYARVVEPCLESVLASEAVPGGIELVVVDDASTDDSVERVHAVLSPAQMPARLVRKSTNTGLADARNLGNRLARGASVFTLDADNLVVPSCLRRLDAARRATNAAAAYALIRRFDDSTGEASGLVSKYAWNVEDLVRSPYIDAMALFDRQALEAVGGYSTELIEHGWFGWEDYDLWLKLAAAGYDVTHVPAVLCAYRVHDDSMLARTNRSSDAIARHFHTKFKTLVDRHPGLDACFGFPRAGSPAARPSRSDESTETLQARCRELEYQVDAIYSSWSWRLTSPLRFIYRLLTGRQ